MLNLSTKILLFFIFTGQVTVLLGSLDVEDPSQSLVEEEEEHGVDDDEGKAMGLYPKQSAILFNYSK